MTNSKIHKKLKIAIYSGEIPSTTFIERLIEGLSKKGHEVYLFGGKQKKVAYPEGIRNKGYRSSKLSKFYVFLKYALLLWFFRYKEKRKLDSFISLNNKNIRLQQLRFYPILWHRPDIFHVQWAKGIGDWVWVQDFGIRLVLSLRGAHINYSPLGNPRISDMYQSSFPRIDFFHGVSKAIVQEGMKYGAPKNRCQVIYSGLNLELLQPKPVSFSTPRIKILSVGRSHWKKGYAYILDACHLLKEVGCSFEYKIIGIQNDEELLYQIKDLNLGDDVSILPNKSFDLIKLFIEESDVLVLSSVEEGIANVVLEAMALGTIVISTNCGGMAEVIEDEVNGFLVPVRDPKALAEKIRYVTSLPKDRLEAIRLEARKTIERKHSMEMMVEGMSALYEQLKINN